MMRGTVYVITDRGEDEAPAVLKSVQSYGVETEAEFKQAAARAFAGSPGVRLEFGPIGKPWDKF